MPRVSRKSIPDQFYHIMCQGINKEYIFKDNTLKNKYRELLDKKRKGTSIKIIAYCIMDNHVHLLVKSQNHEEISKYMQQVNTSYGIYYNKKQERVGFVFRDRYLAKPILSELQLKICVAYIHKNPVAAGITENEGQYKYSSYNEYLDCSYENNIICPDAVEIVFGIGSHKEFIEQYRFIHMNKRQELTDLDREMHSVKPNIEELMLAYKGLSNEEKIKRLCIDGKISERKLAEIFNLSRYQIRKIIERKIKYSTIKDRP